MYPHLLEEINALMAIHIDDETPEMVGSKVTHEDYAIEIMPEDPPNFIPSIKISWLDQLGPASLVHMAESSGSIVNYLSDRSLVDYDLTGLQFEWSIEDQFIIIRFMAYSIKKG